MIQAIWNIVVTIWANLFLTILSIITGKMPKVSVYDYVNDTFDCGAFGACNDKFLTVNRVDKIHKDCQKRIIQEFLTYLQGDENFKNPISDVDFPIFDGKEIIGTQSCYTVIQKSLTEYFNKQ